MEEQPSLETMQYPVHTNTFAVPKDSLLKQVYEVYKPTPHIFKLKSESGRTVYAEAFIEDSNLGTLVDLSVRALARAFGPDPLPMIASDPSHVKTHYDSLDVEMPLKDCYHISNDRFWKRVVLAKSPDQTLALKPDYNWKSDGISMKFVEMVEACAAEFWPEEEMTRLALNIREWVREIHIRRLKSLQDYCFEKYFRMESSSSSGEDDEEISEITETTTTTTTPDETEPTEMGEEEKTESQFELERLMIEEKAERKRLREELREVRQKAREEREARRKRHAAKREKKLELELKKAKKKKKKQPKDFHGIELTSSEEDVEAKICDKRNKELFLASKKLYDYPPEHCHHIDLRFIQWFTSLDTFIIEFLGPELRRNYHYRHLNFSYDDIKRLAFGVSRLPVLRVFRLRNSRMDSKKLGILVDGLKDVSTLEILDLGYDCLNDTCGQHFKKLFTNTQALHSLELESNVLAAQAMKDLSAALLSYNQGKLKYLGLARNPLTDEALHSLISAVYDTEHIESLNLKGVTQLTEVGIACCIADELLRKHPNLLALDISAVHVSAYAADEIMKALQPNTKIRTLHCRGCDLDEETETDINVILKRNGYVAENPFVGNENVTNEEIDAWINRTKNPIMLGVLAEREKRDTCLLQRPLEFAYKSDMATTEKDIALGTDEKESIMSSSGTSESKQLRPFEYKSNEFDEKQFMEHVYLPGHSERYYFFKARRRRHV
uniref:Uncharacterized protein n=1 Tax=Glossina pallidipes TaxID=7398 RepID=A0A1A9ZVJ3_GLOPL